MQRSRLLISISVAAIAAAVLSSTASIAQQKGGTAAPRTSWGDPDLQGTWTSEAELSVPFERPSQYGERQILT
jgi:hypothetical protein